MLEGAVVPRVAWVLVGDLGRRFKGAGEGFSAWGCDLLGVVGSPNGVPPLLAETADCVSPFSGSKGRFRGDDGAPKVLFSGEGDLTGSGSLLGDCGPASSKNLDILFTSSFRGDGGWTSSFFSSVDCVFKGKAEACSWTFLGEVGLVVRGCDESTNAILVPADTGLCSASFLFDESTKDITPLFRVPSFAATPLWRSVGETTGDLMEDFGDVIVST